MQKRYNTEYENLRKEYLSGSSRDITAYLNAEYAGLNSPGLAMQSGMDYLTLNEMANNQNHLVQTNSTIIRSELQMQKRAEMVYEASKGMQSLASFINETQNDMHLQPYKAVFSIMNGDQQVGVQVIVYNPDGSQTRLTYDNDQKEPHLLTMSFLSPEYANKVDNNLAGTSFDSRVALVNDVTACLQASFKDNENDFAIVLNDLEGGHTQGHNALLIGNDVHGYIYLSKDGVADGISGNSLKGIKNHDNLNSFMSSSHGSSYDRFFAIVVTHDVAQNMIKDMLLEMHYPYNPFTSNCGQAVENVLFKNNNISVPSNLSPNFSFNYIIQNTKNGVLFQK